MSCEILLMTAPSGCSKATFAATPINSYSASANRPPDLLLGANPNAFANGPLDRAGLKRADKEWLAAALNASDTQLAVFSRGRPLMKDGAIVWLAGAAASLAPRATQLFLGIDKGGAAHFAIEANEGFDDFGVFADLRMSAPTISADDLATLGAAKAVFEWHEKNGFCANCATATDIADAGWKRVCPSCSREHFPRVDPVVIMVPVFGERCLLGRQKVWAKGMYSALAGFVEPGESIEEAVARETLEEAGLTVRSVALHSSQPWPFPHSLMIGAICEVESDVERVDQLELESARWFTRDEARALIAGKHPDAFAPPPMAIAHQILKTWSEG